MNIYHTPFLWSHAANHLGSILNCVLRVKCALFS